MSGRNIKSKKIYFFEICLFLLDVPTYLVALLIWKIQYVPQGK